MRNKTNCGEKEECESSKVEIPIRIKKTIYCPSIDANFSYKDFVDVTWRYFHDKTTKELKQMLSKKTLLEMSDEFYFIFLAEVFGTDVTPCEDNEAAEKLLKKTGWLEAALGDLIKERTPVKSSTKILIKYLKDMDDFSAQQLLKGLESLLKEIS